MNRPAHYNTKQRETLLAYIASLDGGCATAAQIVTYFEQKDASIGRTTVYRLLDKLVENGVLRRYTVDGVSGACYQFAENNGADCHTHLHLKCEHCGVLLHLECDMLDNIQQHLSTRHAFRINTLKTVLYGQCDRCEHKT